MILRRWIACPIPKLVADASTPVINTAWISRWAWLAVPLLALAFAASTTAIRAKRVEYVSEVAGVPAPAPGRQGPWQPRLVVPGHRNESYEWLDLTRQMLSRRELRVRRVDYENAPSGREVFASSPYRWWLGFVALAYHGVTRDHLGPSLEWAALYADPLLLLILGAGTVAFIAWRFGVLEAALASAALATMFPFAVVFLPGVPDDLGLTEALGLWSILPLLAGVAGAGTPGAEARTRRWFLAAGLVGGVGMWINAPRELPVLVGVGVGALLAAWVERRAAVADPSRGLLRLPWRTWGLAGATTCLIAYIIEYFPSHLGAWELRAIHPLFGVAWLGAAELLGRTASWIGGKKPGRNIREIAVWILAAAAFASLPAALVLQRTLGFLEIELPSMRLSQLPNGPAAATLSAWITHYGFTWAACATFAPVLILVPAALVFILKAPSHSSRVAVALGLGSVVTALAFSYRQMSWWSGVDVALLAVMTVVVHALRPLMRPGRFAGVSAAFCCVVLLPGAIEVWPSPDEAFSAALTEGEVVGLIERDMAYWMANHVGSAPAVVLAPPNQTATLYYYGGIKGLASFNWEDLDGFQAAVRIMGATTPEEAQELIGVHNVTHLIIPSWDPFMEVYAQMGAGQVAGTFLARLREWNVPRWMQPVAYLAPTIPGFEGQSAIVFEVVDEQDDATALSRIAEYFLDMGQLTLATKAEGGLRRFPVDLGALLARAQVQTATGETDDFAKSVDLLVRRIAGGADRDLQWDQRIGLAVVLAQAHRIDLARPRLQQCLAEVDEAKLRALSTILLYRLQILRKALGLEIADPALRSLSLDLLPPDLRSHVE
jgi:hypothetical protein